MNTIDRVRNEVMLTSEQFMVEAGDKYNFWEEHIKHVLRESLELAAIHRADAEIVELAALLYDIALMAKTGTRAEHHIHGAEIAGHMLAKYHYPKEKADSVVKCVLNHRSGKHGETIEEICVADADILAHFDNIPMMFGSILKENSLPLPEVRKRLSAAFERDYNDLSARTKEAFKHRYGLICRIVLGMEATA